MDPLPLSGHLSYERIAQFLRWHPKGSVLLAGSNDSTVWLWQRLSFFLAAYLEKNNTDYSSFWEYDASIRGSYWWSQLWRVHS